MIRGLTQIDQQGHSKDEITYTRPLVARSEFFHAACLIDDGDVNDDIFKVVKSVEGQRQDTENGEGSHEHKDPFEPIETSRVATL